MPSTTASRAALTTAGLLLAATLTACGGPTATPSPTATPDATSAAPTETASATPTPTPSASATPIPVSNNLDAVKVNGEAGAAPEVVVPAPWAIDETRRKVLKEGNGPAATAESIVEIQYTGINGRTGQKFDSSWDRGKPALFSLQQVVPGFTKGLTGAKPGERVIIGMPGADGYDSSGGSPQAGIDVGDSLVFVVDVLAVSVTEATGEKTDAQLPVTLGMDGTKPTITIPAGAQPPAANQHYTVIKGSQRPVTDKDYVMVLYRGYSWKTGQVVDDRSDAPDAGAIGETIDAWKQGIIGQPIGSRVVIVAPNAYPNGSEQPKVEAGDTLVYVVDILFGSSVS